MFQAHTAQSVPDRSDEPIGEDVLVELASRVDLSILQATLSALVEVSGSFGSAVDFYAASLAPVTWGEVRETLIKPILCVYCTPPSPRSCTLLSLYHRIVLVSTLTLTLTMAMAPNSPTLTGERQAEGVVPGKALLRPRSLEGSP